jgi:tRNA threonylcarbamoyladenosine biosynthesis protein TsaB
MKILLIDTCGEIGSVALANTQPAVPKVVSAVFPGRSASERLIGTVRELGDEAGVALGALRAIAVVNGPGSFTGVRVGVSAAKGLSEALGVPVVAISRLAVLAEVGADAQVLTALDAGRGEFYCGQYEGHRCKQEALLSRAEVLAIAFGGARLLVCEPRVAEVLAELSPVMVPAPLAVAALPIAMRRVARDDFDDLVTLDANYLRRTDAEIFAKQQTARAAL